jgi:hypothetical protein
MSSFGGPIDSSNLYPNREAYLTLEISFLGKRTLCLMRNNSRRCGASLAMTAIENL